LHNRKIRYVFEKIVIPMKRLTRKEEEAMKILWKARKGFIKELIDLQPEPKPLYTTFSSVIRGLEEKGYVLLCEKENNQ